MRACLLCDRPLTDELRVELRHRMIHKGSIIVQADIDICSSCVFSFYSGELSLLPFMRGVAGSPSFIAEKSAIGGGVSTTSPGVGNGDIETEP